MHYRLLSQRGDPALQLDMPVPPQWRGLSIATLGVRTRPGLFCGEHGKGFSSSAYSIALAHSAQPFLNAVQLCPTFASSAATREGPQPPGVNAGRGTRKATTSAQRLCACRARSFRLTWQTPLAVELLLVSPPKANAAKYLTQKFHLSGSTCSSLPLWYPGANSSSSSVS